MIQERKLRSNPGQYWTYLSNLYHLLLRFSLSLLCVMVLLESKLDHLTDLRLHACKPLIAQFLDFLIEKEISKWLQRKFKIQIRKKALFVCEKQVVSFRWEFRICGFKYLGLDVFSAHTKLLRSEKNVLCKCVKMCKTIYSDYNCFMTLGGKLWKSEYFQWCCHLHNKWASWLARMKIFVTVRTVLMREYGRGGIS